MSEPEPDVGDDLRMLSIVEPDSFTAARNARAKELRAAKEKDRAAVVAKLTKPTWTAWALNVLARDHAEEIETWLAAGDALDAALGALAGDREGLRDAQQGERVALGRAVERAGEVLVAAGRKADDQARQRLTGTLRAAVTDPAVRDLLVAGTLAEDVEAPSFGFGFAAPDDGNVVSMAAARANRSAGRGTSGGASKGRTKGVGTVRKPAAGSGTTDDTERAEQEAAVEAERVAAEAAEAKRVEAERLAAERLAAERARLEDELATRTAELDERAHEARAADDAARRAHEALDAATDAVDAARAALDALPAAND